MREQGLRALLPSAAAANFLRCYEQMRMRLTTIPDDHFIFLDRSDVFAALTSVEEIFLDSYHFGDRGNEVLAKAIAEGIRPLLA